MFKKINAKLFMTTDDYEFWKNLPNEVIVYRGLQGKKAKVRALSFTLSK